MKDEQNREPDHLMDVNELADFLRVPKSWIYERTRPGAKNPIPHKRVGKYLRFDLREVMEADLKAGG